MKRFLKTSIPLYSVIVFSIILIAGLLWYSLYSQNRAEFYSIPFTEDWNGKDINFKFGSFPELGNAKFFENIKKEFIANKTTFVEANLSEMKLTLYENGQEKLQVPILTKGKEGSWWETPAGLYKIETKETNHFSSFGKVYQPWSMAFQGNFFVHGWPYYPDGTPVASTYSGGCIRLSSEDAKKVFEQVKIGTPILVFEKSFEGDEFTYRAKGPQLSSSHYLAADLNNNFVFEERLSKEVVPIASITKLVTALIVTEYINLDKTTTVPDEAIVYTSIPRLKPGERISIFNLLYPLLLESSNEAAITLSNIIGKDRFISLMNEKARAIGMKNSRFVDPAGISPDNTSTAEDLFALARYLYHNRSFILKISTGRLNHTAYGSPEFTNLKNLNQFEARTDFVGGKVGKTNAAGETMLSVFEITSQNQKRPIAIIVLDSKDNGNDTLKILDWIKNSYSE